MKQKETPTGAQISNNSRILPQIPVPTAPTTIYPGETAADSNYRIVQQNQRARRVAGGGA